MGRKQWAVPPEKATRELWRTEGMRGRQSPSAAHMAVAGLTRRWAAQAEVGGTCGYRTTGYPASCTLASTRYLHSLNEGNHNLYWSFGIHFSWIQSGVECKQHSPLLQTGTPRLHVHPLS